MQSNRVEEVRGINDNYNPLPLSIQHGDDNRCTILMRNETHTIGSLVKERLLRAPEVAFVGCGMVHPPDIKILRTELRLDPGAGPPADELLARSLRSIRGEAERLQREWRRVAGGGGSTAAAK